MEKLVNVSFIILLSSSALLCISALFVVLASKDQDFDKLDISRKFVIAAMLFLYDWINYNSIDNDCNYARKMIKKCNIC